LATCGLLVCPLETSEINQPKLAATKGPSLCYCHFKSITGFIGHRPKPVAKEKHPPIIFVTAARNRRVTARQSQRGRKSAEADALDRRKAAAG
jgi:hypothetical protein